MIDYLKAGFTNYIYGTLFQKVLVRDTPPLQEIGADAEGLTIIITGPTSGIGWSTAAELARRRAHVVLACRNQQKGDNMIKKLNEQADAAGNPRPSLEVSLLDLSSLDSVRQFVERFEAQKRPLHALINNAGMFNMGAGRGDTPDGLEIHMQTNHLSHFLLTMGLIPSFKRAAEKAGTPSREAAAAEPTGETAPFRPRIVSVASHMHRFGYRFGPEDPLMKKHYDAQLAYGNSKLAQMLFTAELNRRLHAAGISVNALAVHPGNVATDVVRSLPEIIQKLYRATAQYALLTPDEGSRASVYAATAPEAPAEAAKTLWFLDCNCKPAQPSMAAGDPKLSAWLWQWSKEQVKLPTEWDLPPAQHA